MIKVSRSEQETKLIAQSIVQDLKPGGIILLSGPLGAGKTTFVQGIAQYLQITQPLISPTYILMRSYPIPHKDTGKLYHLDLYRLGNSPDLEVLGLHELFANPENIVIIEWAEKLGKLIPQNAKKITIKPLSENTREISIED